MMETITTMGRVGIWSLELRRTTGREADAAAELDDRGWGALWIAGAGGPGIWSDAEILLSVSSRATVALGVMSIWSPDAAVAPTEWTRLSQQYGGRIVAGLGVSNPAAAAAAGQTFETPVREMDRFLDRLDGDTSAIPVDHRILGALGPKMVALAGRRAAGIHPFLITPDATVHYRQQLGPNRLIAPHQAVVLESDPREARSIARRGIGMFFGFPSYQQNLRRLGFDDDDFRQGGSDRLIDATVAWGSVDAVAQRVASHHAAGADHVALHVLPRTPGLPLEEWRALADALV